MAFNHYTEADLSRWRESPMNADLMTWLEQGRADLRATALGYTANGNYNAAHQAIGGAEALDSLLASLRRRDAEPVADEDPEFIDPAMPDGETGKGHNEEGIGED